MAAERRFRRFKGVILLLAAVLAAAGGLHNHADLARLAAAGLGPAPGQRVLSSHSPLSTSSHWHSVIRVQGDECLACHLHRFAAVAERAHDPAPSNAGLFVSHAVPQGTARVSRLCDPTRGPPTVS